MMRSSFACAAVVAASISLAGTALAATQEYTITVPVTIKIGAKSLKGANIGSATSGAGAGKVDLSGGLPVTVSCAVGAASIALVGGQATNAAGTGSVTTKLTGGGPAGYTGNVAVTLTAGDVSKPATTYLCWTVVDPTVLGTSVQTPVNFITGKIVDTTKPGTESGGGSLSAGWNRVTNVGS
jgi:hypothetical protein